MSTKEKALHTSQTKQMNHKKSFVFSLICSISFAISNYIVGVMSVKLGFKWVFPAFFTFMPLNMFYHTFNWIDNNKKRKNEGKPRLPFYSKEGSAYIDKIPQENETYVY